MELLEAGRTPTLVFPCLSHCVALAGLQLRDWPAFASQELGLKEEPRHAHLAVILYSIVEALERVQRHSSTEAELKGAEGTRFLSFD